MQFLKNTIVASLGMLSLLSTVFAQKRPLDHSVYDGWQSVSETTISNNGKYIAYLVSVQEGDGNLYVQKVHGDTIAKIARGYEGSFLPNSGVFVCKIKPTYKEARQAKIDKKKDDDLPKDSLVILHLNDSSLQKVPRVKSFQISGKEGSLLAWLSEKPLPVKLKEDSVIRLNKLTAEADSLNHIADSLRNKVAEAKVKGLKTLTTSHKSAKGKIKPEGTDLHIIDFELNDSIVLSYVTDYTVSKKGNIVAAVFGPSESDSIIRVGYIDQLKNKTVLGGTKLVKNLTLDDNGRQLAFIADKDSNGTALRNFYSLYLYKKGTDSALIVAQRNLLDNPNENQISEYAKIDFSKSGNRLFFGTSPILPLKDTSLPEFERVKLDVWSYKEEDLHTMQLYNLDRDLKKNYLAMYDIVNNDIVQLGSNTFRNIYPTQEGEGRYFFTTSDSGRRVARQWLGSVAQDIYVWDMEKKEKNVVVKAWEGNFYPSYMGSSLLLYNSKTRTYSVYNAQTRERLTVTGITTAIYDVENDVPAYPENYGLVGWSKDDQSVYVYGQYDIWKIDANTARATLVVSGKTDKIAYQYISLNKELYYLPTDSLLAFNRYYENTKNNEYVLFSMENPLKMQVLTPLSSYKMASLNKAEEADIWTYTRQNYQESPNIFSIESKRTTQLSNINQQQNQYSWGTAELYKWKSYTGKETEGILYKPENFDPKKKYPLIAYFYERNNETLYNYLPPAPTPSRLNIPFFVSRGYIVFVPDIWYKTGHPGQAAYDYIVSGVRSLVKKGFVDSTKMGIQGQSWGGYQTAYLIGKVPGMFAAAWAGAPVVNMFSAYGGIRWESGMNRQFQYEKTQSRIGATIWDKPQLYVENSPLFNLPKVKTPVVIMANDADGAVPWYQGIEMFTDLRRLGKTTWMLNYNGEAHNLMQRKNRKDIQIREQQFFDWLLKGAKPAPWLVDGIPAVLKDKTMGL